MADDDLRPEDQWPGVYQAYDFVVASYDWPMRRLNAVEGRIQTLMMFSVSLGMTGPVLVASLMEKVSFGSVWFVAALAVALANLVVGMVARTSGGIKLMSLQTVCEDWLHHSEWEFKQLSVYWAGRHFEHNTNVVNKKGRVVLWMTGAFLAEAALMLAWGLGEAAAS